MVTGTEDQMAINHDHLQEGMFVIVRDPRVTDGSFMTFPQATKIEILPFDHTVEHAA